MDYVKRLIFSQQGVHMGKELLSIDRLRKPDSSVAYATPLSAERFIRNNQDDRKIGKLPKTLGNRSTIFIQ